MGERLLQPAVRARRSSLERDNRGQAGTKPRAASFRHQFEAVAIKPLSSYSTERFWMGRPVFASNTDNSKEGSQGMRASYSEPRPGIGHIGIEMGYGLRSETGR